jgi:hypothetical protein
MYLLVKLEKVINKKFLCMYVNTKGVMTGQKHRQRETNDVAKRDIDGSGWVETLRWTTMIRSALLNFYLFV